MSTNITSDSTKSHLDTRLSELKDLHKDNPHASHYLKNLQKKLALSSSSKKSNRRAPKCAASHSSDLSTPPVSTPVENLPTSGFVDSDSLLDDFISVEQVYRTKFELWYQDFGRKSTAACPLCKKTLKFSSIAPHLQRRTCATIKKFSPHHQPLLYNLWKSCNPRNSKTNHEESPDSSLHHATPEEELSQQVLDIIGYRYVKSESQTKGRLEWRCRCRDGTIGWVANTTFSRASTLGSRLQQRGFRDMRRGYIVSAEEEKDLEEQMDSHRVVEEENDGEEEEEEERPVERIIGKKIINKKTHYRVHWAGESEEEATWEPLANLTGCRELIQEYNSRIREAKEAQRGTTSILTRKKRQCVRSGLQWADICDDPQFQFLSSAFDSETHSCRSKLRGTVLQLVAFVMEQKQLSLGDFLRTCNLRVFFMNVSFFFFFEFFLRN